MSRSECAFLLNRRIDNCLGVEVFKKPASIPREVALNLFGVKEDRGLSLSVMYELCLVRNMFVVMFCWVCGAILIFSMLRRSNIQNEGRFSIVMKRGRAAIGYCIVSGFRDVYGYEFEQVVGCVEGKS